MIMSDQNNSTSDELLDDPDDIRVTLELDDEELECAILTIFDVDDQDYIVLVPVDENDEPRQEGEVFIYRYFEDENGNPALDNIASDDEMEKVSDRFDEWLDEQEFEEL